MDEEDTVELGGFQCLPENILLDIFYLCNIEGLLIFPSQKFSNFSIS